MLIVPAQVVERALANVTRDETTFCLTSLYAPGSHGYPQIGWQGSTGSCGTLVHRAVWQHYNGVIADGMTVDHLCKNRLCAEIAHLRLLSNYENARRTNGRNWPLGQCANGHDNSFLVVTGGKRVCRLCRSQWQRDYRARKRSLTA